MKAEHAAAAASPTDRAPAQEGFREKRRPSPYLQALRTPRAIIGLVLVGTMVAAALLGPLLLPHTPTGQSANALASSGSEHLIGTDEVGRDILTRVLHGIRTDLVITLIAVPLAAILGTGLGLVTVLARRVGAFFQRVFDVLLGVPVIILGVALVLALGAGMTAIIVAVVLATMPAFGRQSYAAVNSQMSREYVTAAKVLGTSRLHVLTRHVLPNAVDSCVALVAASMAIAITIEGGLSVMGLGVLPPQPSLGTMIRDGAPYLFNQAQYALVPVIVVVLLVLGYTLIADALNRSVLRK